MGAALEAVLADDDGAFFGIIQAFGDEEDAVGENIGENVEEDFVAVVFGFVEDLAGAKIEGKERVVKAADDVVGEDFSIRFDGCFECFQ